MAGPIPREAWRTRPRPGASETSTTIMNSLPALHTSRADFPNIRRHREFYVDKTPLFRQLLATAGKGNSSGTRPGLRESHLFLARPRRFGKSLLVSTLETWFQGLPPGHDANPSGETGVRLNLPEAWTSPDWLWEGLDGALWHGTHGWHPVIRLDMSRVASADPADTRRALQRYLWRQVNLWGRRGVPWGTPDWVPPAPDDSPSDMLSDLMEALDQRFGQKPVVLVDEYDAPITKHIGTDRDSQPTVEELQDFYRVLKDDQGLLYGVFVTGITRFARAHLFSALNNMTDISDLPAYGALCGFTEAEVEHHLGPYMDILENLEPRFRDRDIRREWRDFYNGYRFSPQPRALRVYNPFTLLRGLNLVMLDEGCREQAAEGRWPSAWSESGHPGLLARLAADTRHPLPDAVRRSDGGRPPNPAPGRVNLTRPDYARLMLETGYYTWYGGADGQPATLNFPNREVAEAWVYDILDLWEHAPERDGHVVHALRACLEQGDVSGFRARLEDFVFGISHVNLQGEASFRTLLQALFMQMELPTQSEKSTLGGRADHEVRAGNRLYVFEVKYNRPVNEARNQIRDRQYGREHLGSGLDVIAVSLSFRRDLQTGPRLECRTENLATLLAERVQDPATAPPRANQHPGPGSK